VKRLRNFADVEVAPSTLRGRATGPALRARARALGGDEARAAERLLVRRHPFVHRVIVPLELRLKRTTNALYELTGFRPLDE
jgi:PPOX class probable F420-dependent enzyme